MKKLIALLALASRKAGFDPRLERLSSGGYRPRLFTSGWTFSLAGMLRGISSLWEIARSPWSGQLDDLWDSRAEYHQLQSLHPPEEGFESVVVINQTRQGDHTHTLAQNNASYPRFSIRQQRRLPPPVEVLKGLNVYKVSVPRLHLGAVQLDLSEGDEVRFDGMILHFDGEKREVPSFRRAIATGLVEWARPA